MTDREGVPVSVYWILGFGLVSFSFSPILVRLAEGAPSSALVVWRNLFAVLYLLPFIGSGRTAFRALAPSDIVRIGIAGMLLGGHFFLFFEAIKLTTVSSATVFVSLTPIFLALLGYLFLHERLVPVVWAGIGLSVVGAVLIALGDAGAGQVENPTLGNLMAISACLIVSIYLILGRVVRQHLSWLTYVLPLYAVSGLTVLVIALATGSPILHLNLRIYGLCALMALGPQLIGHGSFNFAVRYLPAAILGLLSLTEPTGSTLLAYWLFNEFPSSLALIGMGITLAAVVLALSPRLFKGQR